MPMRSSYGIRLYELCLQWLEDEREFSLEEFKRMFQLENKYTAIKDLKKYVINPAIADINTHSDIQVEFHQHKTGRRVTHFQFRIIRQPKPKPKLNTLSLDEWIKAKARAGESWDEARRRLRPEYQRATTTNTQNQTKVKAS